jgi:ZIP family zinc transporter
MNALTLSIAAFVSTACGGLFALKFRHRLHWLLGFTAGVLLGVVSFEILPEIFALTKGKETNSTHAMIALVIGFLFFHMLEKFVLVHHSHENEYVHHHHPHVGLLSALALIGHSFMDGIGIGLGFQISPAVGITVAIAVISHDFCDGMNTVGLMVSHHNTTKTSIVMLVLDALAPIAGVLYALSLQLETSLLVLYLGFFAGFLLYIGASDILPEAHSQAKPREALGLIALTACGAALVFLIAQLSS